MEKIKKKLLEKIKTTRREHFIYILGMVVGTVLFVGVGGGILREEIQEYRVNLRQKQVQEKRREIAEQRAEKIEDALVNSGYEAELRQLYEENPELEKMLLHIEDYEEWLIEYVITNPETMRWVLDYPDYLKLGEEKLTQRALEDVDLSKYEERNGIPVLYQWDEQWGYSMYGNGRLAVTGCAPTCLSMVAIGLTGEVSITPKAVAQLSESLHTFVEGKGTSWELMEVGAEKLGLRSKQIKNWSVQAFCSELQAGNVVICSMGEGDFTQRGHFIVLSGLTTDGKVIVNDPNSKKNSAQEWEPSVLLNQMKGMWVFYR